jgi:phage recombination protein Bet
MYWNEDQLAVIAQMGVPVEVSKAELKAFLHVCQRTRLDPFARQIYLIPRWDAAAGREVYTAQTGIDGLRVIARRQADYGYGSTLWASEDGVWSSLWISDRPPVAAMATVIRSGGFTFEGVAMFAEYAATKKDGSLTRMWEQRPAGQLAKCAEALALRKAFPNDLSGLYTDAELERADAEQPEACWKCGRVHFPQCPKKTRTTARQVQAGEDIDGHRFENHNPVTGETFTPEDVPA